MCARPADGAATRPAHAHRAAGVLRFEGANSAGQKFAFDVALDKLTSLPQGMMIGRAADQCELVVAHATVSRRHARLVFAGEALQIEDQGSTNGTSVNGKAVTAGTPAVDPSRRQDQNRRRRAGVKQV